MEIEIESFLRRFAVLWLAVAVAGCGPSDPLEPLRQQQAGGDFAGTVEPLRALLDEDPDDPEALYLYGLALAGTGDPSLAEWPLREAMKHPEWRLPAGTAMVQGALESAGLPLAIEIARELLEEYPDNVDLRVKLANAHAHHPGDAEEALAEVDRILEIDPDNVDVYEPRILALLALDRAEEAGAAIEEMGERIREADFGPAVEGWHCATAALFVQESGEDELAQERWEDCLERFPGHGNVIGPAMAFYDARGDFERSLEIARRAYEEVPDYRAIRLALVERLALAGESEAALALMEEATRAESPVLAANAWHDLARHYQSAGDLAAAAEAMGQAVAITREIQEPPAQLRFDYADLLLLAGQLDAAAQVTDEMTLPAHREMMRARVAQERGELRKALEHFEEAFQLWPDNPWARYYAALAAEQIGEFDIAFDAYRHSIRIAPGATDARVRLALMLQAEGKPVQALTMLLTKADAAPLGLFGRALEVELRARAGQIDAVGLLLESLARSIPGLMGEAVARAATGLAGHSGAEAAVKLLRGLKGFDLTHPGHFPALRALAEYSREAGTPEAAQPEVTQAPEQYPDVAALHEVLGRWLELGGRTDEARQAYQRALALEPANALALTGLGRLALPDDPEAAIDSFERAVAAAPNNTEARRGAAKAAVALGDPAAAEQSLLDVLRVDPYDGDAAAELVRLDLTRGAASDRTVELARRSIRFGGGLDRLELLAKVHSERGEARQAEQIRARALALQEQRDG